MILMQTDLKIKQTSAIAILYYYYQTVYCFQYQCSFNCKYMQKVVRWPTIHYSYSYIVQEDVDVFIKVRNALIVT